MDNNHTAETTNQVRCSCFTRHTTIVSKVTDCTICFVNPESVIHLLKGVYLNYEISLPIINHTSYIAGGRLKMSPLT